MKLDQLELLHVEVPYRSVFRSSVSAATSCEALLVRVRGEGLTGWGEVVCDVRPSYGPEILSTARIVIETFLSPGLLGRSFASIEDAVATYDWVRGHSMAKAGVELALWDWWGQATTQSLSTLLGGTRRAVEVGVSIGLAASRVELEATLTRHHDDGYRRFKLKVTPGWLEEPIEAARSLLGDARSLAVDANGAFELTALDRLRQLPRLSFLEQPFGWDDLVDHAALKRAGAVPICLDESMPSASALRSAIALDAFDVLNVKPGRVGGLLAARRCLALARAAGLETFVGGMLETAIGRAGNVALASLGTVSLPSDLSASSRYFERDVATPFVLGPNSTLQVPATPGLGVVVDDDALRHFSR
jgi:O-succinylbenzoate synthase